MRVLVADDQIAVRSALALLLEQESYIEVVGLEFDARGALRAVAQQKPDVILLDWELPGAAAADLVPQLRRARPQVQIVALSSQPEAQSASLLAGADAFVDKCDPPETLLEALRHIAPQNS